MHVISCQNVSHALQFRSKNMRVWHAAFISRRIGLGWADDAADLMFFP